MPHIRIAVVLAAFASVAMAPASVYAQGPSATAWVAPARAAQRVNPLAATADVIKHGHDVFHRDCEQCHGKLGHGDGPQGISLTPRPADLASEHVQSQSDGAFFWKMSEGRGVMPKATIGENDKWAVVNYIRSLATKK
jgi:mono/diheme cytochrome c family protein